MSENNRSKIAFTGHRHLKYDDVASGLESVHAGNKDAIWITGGAMGLDSHAASFALDNGISLWLVLPFPPRVMSAKWPKSSLYRTILGRSVKECARLSVLHPVFDISIYQRRNERMVDLCDSLAAFFDGSPGGTANCVRYAQRVGKRVVMLLKGS